MCPIFYLLNGDYSPVRNRQLQCPACKEHEHPQPPVTNQGSLIYLEGPGDLENR